jgi:hypothetical protein
MKLVSSLAAVIFVIVCLGAIFSYTQYRDKGSVSPSISTSTASYENSTYQYAISYPSGADAHQVAPEFVVVSGADAKPIANVAVLHAGISEPLPSYEDFVRLTVQLACQRQTGDCVYSSKQPYTTTTGQQGEAWYFKRGGEKRGPFYTFDVSSNVSNDKYGVLVIYPPGELAMSAVRSDEIKAIADSLQIRKK